MNAYTSKITLPIEFFTKERTQAYSNWRTAYWRELLANSLDAGATELWIDLQPGYIMFRDNGPGMSREIAENVYLTVGKSSKDSGEGTVGGFGRARVLTCFSMERYLIETQDYFIEGSGADYLIQPNVEFYPGFTLFAWAADISDKQMKNALVDVLSCSNLPNLKIHLNNEVLHWANLLPNPETTLTFPLGSVFLSSHRTHVILVRVNGLVMFDHFSAEAKDGALVFEIDPAQSREVLTANRDGPKPVLATQIVEIEKLLARQGKESLTPNLVSFTQINQGQLGHRITKPVHSERVPQGRAFDLSASLSTFERLMDSAPKPKIGRPTSRITVQPLNLKEALSVQSFSGMEVELQTQPWESHNIAISVHTKNPAVLAQLPVWRPEAWFGTKSYQGKLFAVWEFFCENSIHLLQAFKPREIQWSAGFCFRKAEAVCFSDADFWGSPVTALLCYNPFKVSADSETTDLRHPTLNRSDLKIILSTALHEAVHIVESSHDIDFASLLTCLFAEAEQGFLLDQAEWLVKRY